MLQSGTSASGATGLAKEGSDKRAEDGRGTWGGVGGCEARQRTPWTREAASRDVERTSCCEGGPKVAKNHGEGKERSRCMDMDDGREGGWAGGRVGGRRQLKSAAASERTGSRERLREGNTQEASQLGSRSTSRGFQA